MNRARPIDFDEFTTANRSRFAGLAAKLGVRRGARRRARDPFERRSLMDMDIRRLRRMYAIGERRWIGPRTIVVRLDRRA